MATHDLNVLMILDRLNMGGTETYIISLTKELMRQGISVVIAGRSGPLLHSFKKIGCPVYTTFPRSRLSIERKIEFIIRKHHINIIHAHQTPSGLLSSNVSSKLKIPLVFTVHGTYYNRRSLRKILNRADTAISVSPPVRDWLNSINLPNILIPNGIDPNEYAPVDAIQLKKQFNIPAEAPVLLYASRLGWGKVTKCISFIKAGVETRKEHFPSLQLVIAGSGKYEKKIKSFISSISDNKDQKFIHFLGARSNMPQIYALSDCVVGTGRVALESMSCERPLIALGSHGLFGLVEPHNYKDAWEYYFCDHKPPFENEDVNASLATIFQNILASPNDRTYLSTQGRQFILDRFQISYISHKIIEVYQSAISNSKKRE